MQNQAKNTLRKKMKELIKQTTAETRANQSNSITHKVFIEQLIKRHRCINNSL